MVISDILVTCPDCHVKIRCPFIPYDFEGNFVSQEKEFPCPKCGYPLKFSTKEIEEQLDKEDG